MSDQQSRLPTARLYRTLLGVAAGLAGLMAALGVTDALGVGGAAQTCLGAAAAGFMIGRVLRVPRKQPQISPLRALYLAHRAQRTLE
jgi:hypothetical protein